MASVVTAEDSHSLRVTSCFLRRGDLIGLVWDSEDAVSHPAHRREGSTDYSRCQLSFRWESRGLAPLDAVNGPTLTIEGEDADGRDRTWYVRLWNYASGQPDAADIHLDFAHLHGGFLLPAEADPVWPNKIRRMFISLVSPAYAPGSDELLSGQVAGELVLSNIRADGSGSVLQLNDAVAPEHGYRICTGYDDLYHLTPERVLDAIERLGFRKVINHYVGMSHYFGLGAEGKIGTQEPLNPAALVWHEAFARAAVSRGYRIIWSLSYEILDMFCPEAWKQRDADGQPALTGYNPPSTLLSPANASAMEYLQSVALVLCKLSADLEQSIEFQIGEPWWWVTRENKICLYDHAARIALNDPPIIDDVRDVLTPGKRQVLDAAGEVLAGSTRALAGAVKSAFPAATTLLLTYLPGSLRPDAPELWRANLPVGWRYPAFDVLQLEDYEWVTARRSNLRFAADARANDLLGYPVRQQHYLAGFAADGSIRSDWHSILEAAAQAQAKGVDDVFIWALPQILRDGITLFEGEAELNGFDDVTFPIDLGTEASVSPTFSTSIVTSASGYEFRNCNWSQARLRFDAGPGVRGDAELQRLIEFFRARRGSAVAFRFRDPYDHSSNTMTAIPDARDQELGTGDGVRTRFELIKRYGHGEVRRITRPVNDSVSVSIDGEEQPGGWSLQPFGVVEFDVPPRSGAKVSAGFWFDVPVRFAEDHLDVSGVSFRAGEAPSVPLIEVRED